MAGGSWRSGVGSPRSPRGSVGSSADELCPCGVTHWSCESQPPWWAPGVSPDRWLPSLWGQSLLILMHAPAGVWILHWVHWRVLKHRQQLFVSSIRRGKKADWLHPLMLAGMQTGTRLYYKAGRQTGEDLPDVAVTACPETADKMPNKERSKRCETCTWHSTPRSEMSLGAACAVQDRGCGRRLQTMVPHACSNFAIKHTSPKVRTNALISKCPTEMESIELNILQEIQREGCVQHWHWVSLANVLWWTAQRRKRHTFSLSSGGISQGMWPWGSR